MSFINLQRIVLTVGAVYLISDGVKNKEVRLVRTTMRGFNFVNTRTGKLVFRRHIYPQEINRDVKELTFYFPRSLVISDK